MTPTKWREPKTGEELLRVKYRNGIVDDKPRKAAQMNWDDWGSDWDIIETEFWK